MKTENEKKALDLLHNLPEAKQVEALDFLEFLCQKFALPSEKIQSKRERLFHKAAQIKRKGGPRLNELIKELGGPREPMEGWDSTEFIRQDRDRR